VAPPPGIVSWWRGEGNFKDALELNPGPVFSRVSFAAGKVGKAFAFSSSSQPIIIPDTPSLNPTNALTVETWIAFTPYPSRTNGVAVMGKEDPYSDRQYLLSLVKVSGQWTARASIGRPGVFYSVNGGTPLVSNSWNHVAMSFDGAALSLYLNGVLDASVPVSGQIFPSPQAFLIGGSMGSLWGFTGLIDEPALYARALSAAEIKSIFDAGSLGKCPIPVPPKIVTQPVGRTVHAGNSAALAVTATGDLPLSYQWRVNGVGLAGQTSPSLWLPQVELGDAGVYTVVVTNLAGAIVSSETVLTVLTNATACIAAPGGLAAWWKAEGDGQDAVGVHHAQWSGAVAFSNSFVGQAFSFAGTDGRVVVPDAPALNFGPGQDFSFEAWVEPMVSTTEYGVMSIVDKRYCPDYSGSLGYEFNLSNGRVHCRLSDSSNGNGAEFGPAGPDLRDGSFHHVALTVIRNQTNGGALYVDGQAVLVFDPTAVAGDLSNTEPFRIGNHAALWYNGFYKGRIDEMSVYRRGLSAEEVAAVFSAGAPGKCSAATPPQILRQPASQTAFAGSTVSFQVSAMGQSPLSYQWRFNGATLAQQTQALLVLPNVQLAQAGAYSVVVSNQSGVAISADANLTVLSNLNGCLPVPAGIVGWWRAEGNANDSAGTNGASLTGGVAYANGQVAQAFVFNGVDGRVAIPNAPELNFSAGQDFSIEAWIQPQPSLNDYGVMSVVDKRVCPSIVRSKGYEFNLSGGQVHCRFSDSESGNGREFGPAGPDLRDGQFHHIALTMARNSTTGGKMYVDGQVVLTFDPTPVSGDLSTLEPLRIGNHSALWFNGFFRGRIDEVSLYNRALTPEMVAAIYAVSSAGKCSAPSPLAILQQPESQTVAAGATVEFAVVAAGHAWLGYQWTHDGVKMVGETHASLTLTNVQPINGGIYQVLVSSPAGTMLSSEAMLVVTSGTGECVPAPAGLVGWWRGEANGIDAAGTNTAHWSGDVNFGVGQVAQAFSFGGENGRVTVPNAPELNFAQGQDFSIEAWIQPIAVPRDFGVMSIVDKRSTPNLTQSVGYEFNLADGQLHCRLSGDVNGNGLECGPAGPDLRDGSFHHVALTVARGVTEGGRMYVDGQVVLTFDPTSVIGDLSSPEPLRIGHHAADWFNGFFKGRIDEVCIYRQALSEDQVRAVFKAGSAGKCVINRRPAIRPMTILTAPGQPIGLPVEKLLMLATDPDGDPLTVIAVSGSTTNGGSVALATNTVTYVPPVGFLGSDGFTFAVSDGRGEATQGVVWVEVRPAEEIPSAGQPLAPKPGGFELGFSGIPGAAYTLERATSPAGPWVSIGAFKMGMDGHCTYVDTNSPSTGAFYRSVRMPALK
jgi:hypothetical protein